MAKRAADEVVISPRGKWMKFNEIQALDRVFVLMRTDTNSNLLMILKGFLVITIRNTGMPTYITYAIY